MVAGGGAAFSTALRAHVRLPDDSIAVAPRWLLDKTLYVCRRFGSRVAHVLSVYATLR